MNKKTTLKDSLFLKPKTTDVPKSPVNLDATEKALKTIHAPAQSAAPKKRPARKATPAAVPAAASRPASAKSRQAEPEPPLDERTKRITLDIPQTLHTAMKIKTFHEGITLREYLLRLAERDLKM